MKEVFSSVEDGNNQSQRAIIESLIFSFSEPLSLDMIHRLYPDIKEDEVDGFVDELNQEYYNHCRSFFIQKTASGWVFISHQEYAPFLDKVLTDKKRRTLSSGAMEVASIVAYKQPITRAEIDYLRGKNSSYALSNLLELSYIQVAGRKEIPGRPLLYEVTKEFLDVLGLQTIDQMPKLEEIEGDE